MEYKGLSFVLSGKLRQAVIRALVKPKTPAQLTSELSTQDSSVSRTLKELEGQKLVENMFPDKKKGRIYKLTKTGEQVLRSL